MSFVLHASLLEHTLHVTKDSYSSAMATIPSSALREGLKATSVVTEVTEVTDSKADGVEKIHVHTAKYTTGGHSK